MEFKYSETYAGLQELALYDADYNSFLANLCTIDCHLSVRFWLASHLKGVAQ